MISAKLLAVAYAVWTALPAKALVLGVRQDLADSPLGVAFPTPLNPPRIGPLPSVSVIFTTPTPTTSPTGTLSSPGSGGTSDPSFDDDDTPGFGTGPVTETGISGTPTDMPTIPGGSTSTSLIVLETDAPKHDDETQGNRTLVITLSSVLSVVGLLLILGALFLFWRIKKGRKPLFSRGISPIDDDEIATWKVPHSEKVAAIEGPRSPDGESPQAVGAAGAVAAVAGTGTPRRGSEATPAHSPSHTKKASTSSLLKKPPSVIVYSNPHGTTHRRCSSDDSGSFSHEQPHPTPPGSGGRKMSFDKMLPQTPIQARAPNAIPGLTDESVPGDMPFLPTDPPAARRLSKLQPRRAHVRSRSSRSSSFGDSYGYGGSDFEGRHSHDYVVSRGQQYHGHWRMYSASSSSIPPPPPPPRLSFDINDRGGGWKGLHGEREIGKAIG